MFYPGVILLLFSLVFLTQRLPVDFQRVVSNSNAARIGQAHYRGRFRWFSVLLTLSN
jgi:hypothetical protein